PASIRPSAPPTAPHAPHTLSSTTLFRSHAGDRLRGGNRGGHKVLDHGRRTPPGPAGRAREDRGGPDAGALARQHQDHRDLRELRSEEHTSELQSLAYRVWRLALEKKKEN